MPAKSAKQEPPVLRHGCHNCTHWVRLPDGEQAPGEDVLGHCCRYPPMVVGIDDTDGSINQAWPIMAAQERCGEHDPQCH